MKNKIFSISSSFFLFLLLACSSCSQHELKTMKTSNGGVFVVKSDGPSLIVYNNGKPLVEVVDSGNSQFIETFANGMTSLKVGYKKDSYEPTTMALALGSPQSSKVIIYDSEGHVKQEINNVKQFLEDNADKLKQAEANDMKVR